jgi:hypothetical protein
MSFDEFIISAVPSIKNINPLKIFIFNQTLSSLTQTNVTLKGGTFYVPQYVYLSASNNNMFDNTSIYTLSTVITGQVHTIQISAILVPEFSYVENYITFKLPQIPNTTGTIDVIVQNEAGHGNLLTSLNYSLTSGIQVLEI